MSYFNTIDEVSEYVREELSDVSHIEFTSFGICYITDEIEEMCNDRLRDITPGVLMYYLEEGGFDLECLDRGDVAYAIAQSCTPPDFPDNACVEVFFKGEV